MTTQTQKIHAAADAISANGKRPTLAAVREAVGGGSFTTISEAMKTWSGRSAAPAEIDTTPEAVTRAGVEQAVSLWQQAKVQADERLKAERAALDEARAEFEQETAEAAALADMLATENEALKMTIEQLKSDMAKQQKELAAVTTKAISAETAEAALAECRVRAEQLVKQLEREEKKSDEAREMAARAREEAAELRGRMVSTKSV